MKRRLILALAVLYTTVSFAQSKKIEDTSGFLAKLEKATSTIKSIESDFKQVKRLEIYSEDLASSGRFYYKFQDKISLKYAEPYPYRVVINGSKMMMETNGKKNVMDLKDNKLMNEMQKVLTICMTGKFSAMSKDYKMDFFEDTSCYLVVITPTSKAAKAYVSKFEIYLSKKDMSVDKLRISETEKDYTEYTYTNKKFNTLSNDSLFAL